MPNQVELILKAGESLYDTIVEDLSAQSSKKYNNDLYDLSQLDNWRLVELPQILAKRYEESKKTWLTKDELVLLMDWKLAKGKFRPTLPKLIKSNSEEDVEKSTTEGFKILLDFLQTKDRTFWKKAKSTELAQYVDIVKKSIKAFSELRGVGPATASLISSLVTGINDDLAPPFFSDESFLYYVVDRTRPDTKIKYNVKEYAEELLPVYFDILREDETANVGLLERGAWALKTYQLLRVTTLADVKVPFEYDEDLLQSFGKEEEEAKPSTKKRVKEEVTEKRKRQNK